MDGSTFGYMFLASIGGCFVGTVLGVTSLVWFANWIETWFRN